MSRALYIIIRYIFCINITNLIVKMYVETTFISQSKYLATIGIRRPMPNAFDETRRTGAT